MSAVTSRSVLLLQCPDASGIVADVAKWVADNGGNIVDAAQYSDARHGLFLQRVEFDHDVPTDQLRSAFAPVAKHWQMQWQLHTPNAKARLSVLVTKEAHCLYDLLGRCATGDLNAEVVEVISNRVDLQEVAERFAVPFAVIEDPEKLDVQLRSTNPDLIVLARYMRILTPEFCDEFGSHTINIHHSFLPAFIGANAYKQAWERGVKLIGATAHYVTADLDEGPIIAQEVARVSHADSPGTMARRGRDLESLTLATAVRAHLENRVIAYAHRTVVFE